MISPRHVNNPLDKDFTVKYASEDRTQKEYIVKSGEIAEFEPHIAKHIKKHLVDHIFDMRGKYNKKRGPQIEEFYKEVSVEI